VEGKRLIQRQIELGDPVGYLHLAKIAEEGIGEPVDLQEAYVNSAIAAGRGLTPGFLRMARMMMLGLGVRACPPSALDMYRRLIETFQSTDAMTALGVHYYHGQGLKKDKKKGVALLKKAASLGNKSAQGLLKRLK
jgi:TPR repeat protein